MNMFDEARSLAVMIKMRNLSQNEVAKMLGVSQSYVANKIRLLGLDAQIQNKISAAGLSERHARALLRLDQSRREEALEKIIERKMSVSKPEAMVDIMRCESVPITIGRSDRLAGIDIFLNGVKNSLSSLSAIGITASQKVSYHGSKIVVTILLDEG